MDPWWVPRIHRFSRRATSMHGRHGDMDRVAGGGQHDWFLSVSEFSSSVVPAPIIGEHDRLRANHIAHKRHQPGTGSIGNMTHPHPSKAWGLSDPPRRPPRVYCCHGLFCRPVGRRRPTFHQPPLRRTTGYVLRPPSPLGNAGASSTRLNSGVPHVRSRVLAHRPVLAVVTCHAAFILFPHLKTIPPILIRARIGSAGRQMRGKMRCLRLRPTLALTYCGLVLFPG